MKGIKALEGNLLLQPRQLTRSYGMKNIMKIRKKEKERNREKRFGAEGESFHPNTSN